MTGLFKTLSFNGYNLLEVQKSLWDGRPVPYDKEEQNRKKPGKIPGFFGYFWNQMNLGAQITASWPWSSTLSPGFRAPFLQMMVPLLVSRT